ncbi:MAG: hypothetical protein PHP97_00140 [Candidatus Shapirobacteria bacterium]|nr:hypothetical protein [Candidatus Shapirobacteria bacterium]MDD3002937.1 hypothetical protein [Candidatus Shapirobacteria bacterium]MDD4383377.1 hypothetical protein [Candidatus Shapirobacteria bacterium]
MIKKIIPTLIIIALLISFYFLTSKKPASLTQNNSMPQNNYILFYGTTCPHCKIVEEFVSTNQIDQKLKISQLEVYENESNKTTFSKMVQQICPDQLSNGGLPVPFLVDQKDQKCIIGDAPITEYLTEKSK